MSTNKKIIISIIPAILIAGLGLFIVYLQYQPLYPKISDEDAERLNGFNIPTDNNDPKIGLDSADRKIIIFEDFSCSSCKEKFTLLEKLILSHPNKIQIIWKGIPSNNIKIDTTLAHRYAHCSYQQDKFIEFYKLAFNNNKNLTENTLKLIAKNIDLNEKKLNKCLNSEDIKNKIQDNLILANLLNIQKIPTIFYNSKQIVPPETVFEWEKLLNL